MAIIFLGFKRNYIDRLQKYYALLLGRLKDVVKENGVTGVVLFCASRTQLSLRAITSSISSLKKYNGGLGCLKMDIP